MGHPCSAYYRRRYYCLFFLFMKSMVLQWIYAIFTYPTNTPPTPTYQNVLWGASCLSRSKAFCKSIFIMATQRTSPIQKSRPLRATCVFFCSVLPRILWIWCSLTILVITVWIQFNMIFVNILKSTLNGVTGLLSHTLLSCCGS